MDDILGSCVGPPALSPNPRTNKVFSQVTRILTTPSLETIPTGATTLDHRDTSYGYQEGFRTRARISAKLSDVASLHLCQTHLVGTKLRRENLAKLIDKIDPATQYLWVRGVRKSRRFNPQFFRGFGLPPKEISTRPDLLSLAVISNSA